MEQVVAAGSDKKIVDYSIVGDAGGRTTGMDVDVVENIGACRINFLYNAASAVLEVEIAPFLRCLMCNRSTHFSQGRMLVCSNFGQGRWSQLGFFDFLVKC